MPSGLCAQCGPSGAKKLVSTKQVKQVKMVLPDQCRVCSERQDGHAGGHPYTAPTPIYLCGRCRRDLGYAS
jgi:hypothetical protein